MYTCIIFWKDIYEFHQQDREATHQNSSFYLVLHVHVFQYFCTKKYVYKLTPNQPHTVHTCVFNTCMYI